MGDDAIVLGERRGGGSEALTRFDKSSRHLRNRAIEAFREADMSVFEEFKAVREVKQIDPIAVKAQSFLTAKSGTAMVISGFF